MQIPELSTDDYETLLLMCGYAVGSAFRIGERAQGYCFLRLTNKLFENNPNFTPYAIPVEGEQIAGKVS